MLRLVVWGVVVLGHLACRGVESERVVSPLDLYDQLERSVAPRVLDVRAPWEFRAGHIPSALNVPSRALAAQLARLALPLDAPIVVYGESGTRAARAAQVLADSGYRRVLRLAGDMQGWRRSGLPVAVGGRSEH